MMQTLIAQMIFCLAFSDYFGKKLGKHYHLLLQNSFLLPPLWMPTYDKLSTNELWHNGFFYSKFPFFYLVSNETKQKVEWKNCYTYMMFWVFLLCISLFAREIGMGILKSLGIFHQKPDWLLFFLIFSCKFNATAICQKSYCIMKIFFLSHSLLNSILRLWKKNTRHFTEK